MQISDCKGSPKVREKHATAQRALNHICRFEESGATGTEGLCLRSLATQLKSSSPNLHAVACTRGLGCMHPVHTPKARHPHGFRDSKLGRTAFIHRSTEKPKGREHVQSSTLGSFFLGKWPHPCWLTSNVEQLIEIQRKRATTRPAGHSHSIKEPASLARWPIGRIGRLRKGKQPWKGESFSLIQGPQTVIVMLLTTTAELSCCILLKRHHPPFFTMNLRSLGSLTPNFVEPLCQNETGRDRAKRLEHGQGGPSTHPRYPSGKPLLYCYSSVFKASQDTTSK